MDRFKLNTKYGVSSEQMKNKLHSINQQTVTFST